MNHLLLILSLLTAISAHANDLTMFSLKGPVDSLCIVMDDAGLTWQSEFKFDKKGLLIEFDGIEVDTERDKNNHIVDLIIEDAEDGDETVTIETKLEYDATGKVIKTITSSPDEEWTETFSYDRNGRLKSRNYTSPEVTEQYTYTYLKEDAQGNWTVREEKAVSMNQIITHTRKIIYRAE